MPDTRASSQRRGRKRQIGLTVIPEMNGTGILMVPVRRGGWVPVPLSAALVTLLRTMAHARDQDRAARSPRNGFRSLKELSALQARLYKHGAELATKALTKSLSRIKAAVSEAFNKANRWSEIPALWKSGSSMGVGLMQDVVVSHEHGTGA